MLRRIWYIFPRTLSPETVPRLTGTLLGDKTWGAVLDNGKIRSYVPGFECRIPFREGIRRLMNWFAEEDGRRRIDDAVN